MLNLIATLLYDICLIPAVKLCTVHQSFKLPCLHVSLLLITGDHVIAVTADIQALNTVLFADCTPTHTSGNSSIDTSQIRDIYCGPEVLFETYVTMKFVDDDKMDGKKKFTIRLYDMRVRVQSLIYL